MAQDEDLPHIAEIDGIRDPNRVPRTGAALFDAPAPGSCPLGGSWYPDGSTVVYAGQKVTCEHGHWV